MTKSTLISMYTIHQRPHKWGIIATQVKAVEMRSLGPRQQIKKKHTWKFPLQTRFFDIFRENPFNDL